MSKKDSGKDTGKEAAEAASSSKKVRVKVNPERGVRGIAYYDRSQKVTIGEKAVSVERSPFVTRLLLTEELVEA